MKRFMQIADSEILVSEVELVVELSQEFIGKIALEITMLLAGIASHLTLVDKRGSRIIIAVSPVHNDSAKAHVQNSGTGAWGFDLPQDMAEYVQAFLLRAYRDSVAEVNHIHLEGQLDGHDFDLTLFFAESREPLTAEEASRLIED